MSLMCACSNDDESSDSLSGKWEAYTTDGDSQGTQTFILKNGSVTYIEKWTEPGYEDDVETYDGPYIIEDDLVTMNLVRRDVDYNYNYVWVFKWEIDGKNLTLTPNDYKTKEYWSEPIVLNKK